MFPKRHILDSSKLTKFPWDIVRFDENGGNFYQRIENTVGKGEIARYEQFLLFPRCFLRLVLQTRKYQGLFRKGLTKSAIVMDRVFIYREYWQIDLIA